MMKERLEDRASLILRLEDIGANKNRNRRKPKMRLGTLLIFAGFGLIFFVAQIFIFFTLASPIVVPNNSSKTLSKCSNLFSFIVSNFRNLLVSSTVPNTSFP